MDDLNLLQNIDSPETSETITTFSETSSGMFKQTQDYIDNLKGDDYKEYISLLNEYFMESTKNKYKKGYDFFIDNDGNYVKKCKPGNTKTKNEIKITPPKYIDVDSIIKEIVREKNDLEYELIQVRDELFTNPDNNQLNKRFNLLKEKFIELNNKHKIFTDYSKLVNDKNNNKRSELLIERAKIRNDLRVLFEEIKNLKKGNDYKLLDEKIKEYLSTNTILDIEKKIKEMDENVYISKIVSSLPVIKKGEKSKRRLIRKKITSKSDAPATKKADTPPPPAAKKAETPPPPAAKKAETPPSNSSKKNIPILQEDLDLLKQLEKPKKRRIKRSKQKGGEIIDLNNLLDPISENSEEDIIDFDNLLTDVNSKVKVIKLN